MMIDMEIKPETDEYRAALTLILEKAKERGYQIRIYAAEVPVDLTMWKAANRNMLVLFVEKL